MNYQTLYRKYRSQTFGDLVGQEATRRALMGAIASDRVAHAYLFSGTRGTGKTTTARLLAKAVNCLQRKEGSAEPCNACESCLEVQAGSALDLIEIDAASNRGIDEIRDLRERVNLAPALGRRKVYIIDEAHMLTAEAFNALLKTLEEPPEHVMFVLCTTEAHKVPLTVLGRCQQFVFRRFSEEQISARLAYIASREGIAVEEPALRLLAQVAQGTMRDAIGLLDQLVPLADGPITLEGAREMLGIADPARVGALLDQVLAGDAAGALASLTAIYEGGGELRQVVRGLMEGCRDRLVSAIERRDLAARARLSGVLDALLHLDGEVRRHAEPRFLVEATLVRLAVDATPEAAPVAAAAPKAAPVAAAPVTAAPPAAAPVATPPVATPAPSPGDGTGGWRAVLDSLPRTTKGYYREARPLVDGDRLTLVFKYSFHYQRATETREQVVGPVQQWLGEKATIELKLLEPDEPVRDAPPRPPAPEEHPLIKAAERQLEGRVVRVKPLKES